MFNDISDRIKEGIEYLKNTRLIVLILVFCLSSSILVGRLFYLQIVKGEDYVQNHELQIRKTKEIAATRGNIFDRNGEPIAYNELAYSVTIEDTVSSDASAKERNRILNSTLEKVLTIVEEHGDSVIDSFGIYLDPAGNYQFTETNETQRLRFVADVYGKAYIEDLKEEERQASAADLIKMLCKERYGLATDNSSPDRILKIINMRYAMGLNSFQQFMSTTLAYDVSKDTAAAIMENLDSLPGVDIEEDSLRRYDESECFASLIGYTGQISQEEYDALDEDEKKKYSLSDIIGKSGLEQTMDSVLQGTKGKTTFYVDNVGKVTETVSTTNPEAGNDVYLTIDKNLQIEAYHLLEEKIAGIVLERLTNVLEYDASTAKDSKEIIIPVGDAYNAFISNGIVSLQHFSSADAGASEREVYAAFQAKHDEVLSQIIADLQNSGAAAYKDVSSEMKAYLDYVCDTVLVNTGILLTNEIDTSDETYIAWVKEETINLNTYLNYAISKNWIDTTKLGGGSYSSSEEIYQELVAFLQDYLSEDGNFDKLLYEYLIKSGGVTGEQICSIAYEQGVLEQDEEEYQGLRTGSVSAYSWLCEKIRSLEITPGQLALEPCSGGLVVTDPQTGDVLACVSYPGYDNNRLANTMDSRYYNQLNTGLARTFYNRATQEITAPGSTYKMISSIAGLTEGVIDSSSYIGCGGPFKKITPSPECWIASYGGSHGSLNVVGALEHSCNNYFYEVGYRLGTDSDGNYDTDLGVGKLREYAEMFGLNDVSGVEIPESSPKISTQDSVRSAIGQGNNAFTVSQLNRYVTAVANCGTVYDLTLIDKTTDSNGSLIKDYKADIVRQLDQISDTTWNLVHRGMEEVVASSATFSNLPFTMAGKTGTAQQSSLHADHALFVGYAPADTPEISIAVRIAYGYYSNYASEIARDVASVYFDPASAPKLIKGTASEPGTSVSGD